MASWAAAHSTSVLPGQEADAYFSKLLMVRKVFRSPIRIQHECLSRPDQVRLTSPNGGRHSMIKLEGERN